MGSIYDKAAIERYMEEFAAELTEPIDPAETFTLTGSGLTDNVGEVRRYYEFTSASRQIWAVGEETLFDPQFMSADDIIEMLPDGTPNAAERVRRVTGG